MDVVGIVIKAAPAVGAALATYFGPRLWRAFKNRSKTEYEIAMERLDDALKAAAKAHADNDPTNDADADARVAQAKEVARKAKIWAATVEGAAGE